MSTLMLPNFQPDMTFYSWMAITQIMNGRMAGTDLSKQLLGSGSAGTRLDFPSNLSTFCERTANAFGDPFHIAIERTVLPYYLAFRPESFLQDSVQIMARESVETLKFKLGITPGHLPSLSALKFCQECYEEDSNNFGFGYWHRIQQLPTTHICSTHSNPLNQLNLRMDGANKNTLILPRSNSPYLRNKKSDLLQSISHISKNVLLNKFPGGFDMNRLQWTYKHGLKELGFLTASGRVRAEHLLIRVEQHFAELKSLAPYQLLLSDSNLPYFLKLIRKPRGNYNPIAHILLISLFFGSWELFASTYEWQSQFQLDLQDRTEDFDTAPLVQGDLVEISHRYASCESLKQLAMTYGYDIGTLMRQLGKTGLVEIKRRPKKVFTDQIESVLTLLRQGKSLVEIQAEACLSKSTVDRILTSHAYIKQLWHSEKIKRVCLTRRGQLIDHISSNPGLTIKHLREHIGPTIRWLSRNDAVWLQNIVLNLPKDSSTRKTFHHRPRVDWSARDLTCLKALMGIGKIELDTWERIKPPLLLRRLPYLPFKPRLDKLPLTKAWIENRLNLISGSINAK